MGQTRRAVTSALQKGYIFNIFIMFICILCIQSTVAFLSYLCEYDNTIAKRNLKEAGLKHILLWESYAADKMGCQSVYVN